MHTKKGEGLKKKSINFEPDFFSSCLNKLILMQFAQLGRLAGGRKHFV